MQPKKMFMALIILLVAAASAQTSRVLPQDTEIKVRTDTAIPAKPAANTKYAATVSNDVMDKSGAVLIPSGARAQLVAVPSSNRNDTNLDLRSVTINGQEYLLTTQNAANLLLFFLRRTPSVAAATFATTVPSVSAHQGATGAVQQLLNAFPPPNGPEDLATMLARLTGNTSSQTSWDNTSLRIDHAVNQKLTVFGR